VSRPKLGRVLVVSLDNFSAPQFFTAEITSAIQTKAVDGLNTFDKIEGEVTHVPTFEAPFYINAIREAVRVAEEQKAADKAAKVLKEQP
jgi:hypothetical protein